jgi:hypothetical protein
MMRVPERCNENQTTKTPVAYMKKSALLYMTAPAVLLTATLTFGSNLYDTTVINDGAVSYWPMQETTGPTVHDVVGTNNGTMMVSTDNPPCANVSGNNDQCTNFVVDTTGANFGLGAPGVFTSWDAGDTCIYFTNFNHAQIRVPYAPELDAITWTVEAWIQMPANPLGGAYVCPYYVDTSSYVFDGIINFNWNSGSYLEGWDMYCANGLSGGRPGQMRYDMGPGFKANPKENIGLNVNNGKSVYAVMTFDGSTFKTYENGAFVASISGLIYSNLVEIYVNKGVSITNAFLSMGAYQANSFGPTGNGVNPIQARFFNGGLSHVAYFSKALSAGQILNHYIIAVTGTNQPPSFPQPPGFTNFVGYTNSLSVAAAGQSPLAYQWYNADTASPITGATNATLVFSGLTLTNAGNYSIIVTNFLGSVTSAPIAVGVLSLPSNVYQAAVVSEFPSAFYPMNELAGSDMIDLIQAGAPRLNEGVYYAFPALGGLGASDLLGTSVGLDGGSEGANITNQSAMNIVGPITLEAWVQIGETNFDQYIVAHGPYFNASNPSKTANVLGITIDDNNTNGNGYYYIESSREFLSGSNYVTNFVGAYFPIPAADLPGDGSAPWVHLVGAVSANGGWSVGAKNNDDGVSLQPPYFYGSIQDVAIYSYGLTPQTIQQHYQLGLTGGYTNIPLPAVSLQLTNGNAVLNWAGGNLASATNVSGPWTFITNPDSSVVTPPYTVPRTNTAQFFKASLGAP